MKRTNLLYTGFLLIFLLAVLNQVALAFYLYWDLAWYDIMMHFLGGLSLGVFAAWLFNIRLYSIRSFLLLFISVLAASVAWEIFEYVYDTSISTENYPVDTAIDLVMDSLGAITAYWYATLGSRQSS